MPTVKVGVQLRPQIVVDLVAVQAPQFNAGGRDLLALLPQVLALLAAQFSSLAFVPRLMYLKGS